jgi:hypothetical protein
MLSKQLLSLLPSFLSLAALPAHLQRLSSPPFGPCTQLQRGLKPPSEPPSLRLPIVLPPVILPFQGPTTHVLSLFIPVEVPLGDRSPFSRRFATRFVS